MRSLAGVLATPRDGTLAGSTVDAAEIDHVLVLRPGQPGVAPLVLLPPAGGLGWAYARLLRHLPPERPVIVVQGEGLGQGAAVEHPDLDSLVARQWTALAALLPDLFGPGTQVGSGHLPVHVAGWSLGGMAAHALAAHLGEQGVAVGAVVLLDAYPSAQWRHLPHPTRAEALQGVLRMAGLDTVDNSDEEPHAGAPQDSALLDDETVVARLRRSGSAMAALPAQVLQGCVHHVVAATGLVRDSATATVSGDIHVVVAGAPRSEDWLDVRGWEPHVRGQVTTTVLPAGHGELLREPWVGEVGAVLKTRCALADTGALTGAGA